MFKRYRIDYLLFAGFAAFIVLLLSVVIWVAYSFTTKQMVHNTSYYQQNLLDEIYGKVVIQMKSIEQITLTATFNSELLDYMKLSDDPYNNYLKREEMESFLAQLTYATPDIETVDFYVREPIPFEPQGPVRFLTHAALADEPWYSVVENADSAWIGEHTIQTAKGERSVVSFARKVYTPSGDYNGLLVLNVKSSALQMLIQGKQPNVNRMLYDSGGRLIVAVGAGAISRERLNGIVTRTDRDSGYVRIQPTSSGEGDDALMVWAKHFNKDWVLVELTPWRDITSGSVRVALLLLLAGGASIFIALIFTLFFSRQFVKPIRLLLTEMSHNSINVNRIHLPTDYRNEFGVLFSSYRKLIERIQELYASLESQYRRQKETEIKSLQAMINPHFLYNTLDQLNWMAIASGQEKMSRILELMGRMFRIGLSNGESFISIQDELLHVESYMEIQRLRLGESFTLKDDVPETLRTLYIPKMTLQPFVENSIIHGFHGRTEGTIRIRASLTRENDVLFEIIDDGVGLRSDWQEAGKKTKGGYGIRNVRERIESYFGENYGIELADNGSEAGTTVRIRIPKLTQK